jgi:hypothetical protein
MVALMLALVTVSHRAPMGGITVSAGQGWRGCSALARSFPTESPQLHDPALIPTEIPRTKRNVAV